MSLSLFDFVSRRSSNKFFNRTTNTTCHLSSSSSSFTHFTFSKRWMSTPKIIVDDSGVKVTDYGTVKHVLLNRPKALNSLDLPMVRKLTPLYQEWEKNPDTIVIMRGSGDKAFCAGGDIRAIYDSGKSGGSLPREFFREEYILNYLIAKRSFTHIALLNGITMGGGVGLSVHGKYRIATENTVFAMPETAIGFFCDVGGSYFLSRMEGVGMYLALTGARLKGEQLLSAKIATHFIPSSKLDELETALLTTTNPEETLQVYTTTKPQITSEVDTYRQIIQSVFSLKSKSVNDIIKELKITAEKTYDSPTVAWINKTIESLSKMSPTSLEVVHKQLREGRKLNYPDCFKMEYRISQRFMKGANTDFFEGVRALLVDKDKNPKWNPTSDNITPQFIDSFFQPVENDLILEPSQPSKL